jgi:C-22 sterol desaturase
MLLFGLTENQLTIRPKRVFLTGKVHAEYRKGLNVLFTKKALSIYLKTQEAIRRKHFGLWLARKGAARPMMPDFRDLNMETSLKVFCGDYITDKAAKEISDKYWLITRALELVNFPLALPGTKVYKAIQARKAAMIHLEAAAQASRDKIRAGGECNCLLDNWNQDLMEAGKLDRYSNNEQSLVVLSFIFASQGASETEAL